MPIKMRVSKNDDSTCCSCGEKRKAVLDMFDVMVGNTMLTICDKCMNELLSKSLRAISYTNGRVKQPKEIRIINERIRKRGGR